MNWPGVTASDTTQKLCCRLIAERLGPWSLLFPSALTLAGKFAIVRVTADGLRLAGTGCRPRAGLSSGAISPSLDTTGKMPVRKKECKEAESPPSLARLRSRTVLLGGCSTWNPLTMRSQSPDKEGQRASAGVRDTRRPAGRRRGRALRHVSRPIEAVGWSRGCTARAANRSRRRSGRCWWRKCSAAASTTPMPCWPRTIPHWSWSAAIFGRASKKAITSTSRSASPAGARRPSLRGGYLLETRLDGQRGRRRHAFTAAGTVASPGARSWSIPRPTHQRDRPRSIEAGARPRRRHRLHCPARWA